MRRIGVAAVLLLAGVGGCRHGAADTAASDSGGSTSGGEPQGPAVYRLAFDEDTGETALLRDDVVLLRLPSDAFALGVTDAIDDDASYDPMAELPLEFIVPSTVSVAEGGVLTLALAYPGGTTATVRFEELAPGRFGATWTPTGGDAKVGGYRLGVRCDPAEHFYGLGEVFDHPEHRGRTRAMQLEADLRYEGGSNEIHVPVPLLVGTRGWGLFVRDDHPGRFDVATQEHDLVQVTYGMGPHGGQGLQFALYGAEHPLDVTAHYWAQTGAPARPAPWALGPWLWRNENTDAAQVIADAQTLRDLDLPHTALWIDRPYATGVNTFDFEATRFADPAGMIAALHDLGLRVALWHTPYVSDMDEPATALHDEATAAGYFPPVVGLLLNKWGAAPLDFTNPDAFAWWAELLGGYTALGIEGYKLDYGEDVMSGIGPGRIAWSFADGSDERTMHGRYHTGYHAPYAAALPADGGFILARAGTWGEQTQASVIWPGDLDADLSRFGDDRDGKLAVGGLPAAVAAGLSLSPSGFPLFASDTGGYRHGPPTKETFTRWFQHTALTPVMQIGTGSSNVAWEFAGTDFDDEMLGWYRDFTRLHLRLFPYLWTAVQQLDDEHARPIVRPLGLAYPELGVHPGDEYLLGDDLLVAPVVEPGASSRTVTFPAGRWIGWFDGVVVDAGIDGSTIEIDAPLSTLPLWLRDGGAVALLRPTIDAIAPTGQPTRVDSLDGDAGVLYPRIAAGRSGGATLWDGAALTFDVDDTATTLRWQDGEVFSRGAVVEVLAAAAPAGVTLDGAELSAVADAGALATTPGWLHLDDRGGTLWLGVPAGTHEVVVTW